MTDAIPGPDPEPPEPAHPVEPADGTAFDGLAGPESGLEAEVPLPPQPPAEDDFSPAADPFPARSAASAPGPGRARPFWQYAAVGLAAGVAGALLTAGAFLLWFNDEPATVVQQIETHVVEPGGEEAAAAAVARAVLPSIVTVQVRASSVGEFVAEGSGSGVVLSADGLLVTNHHVVEGAGQVRVVFAGGRTYPTEVVGLDAATDLAVLRIAATGLIPITLGSSQDLEIGDTAIAVGSPLGLEGGPSVTVGVVSAFDRRLGTGDDVLYGMIQTDAPITRGSSGGALVDASGRLIGITTAIGVSDVGAEGLGFAIPVELVALVTEQLADGGVASHPFMGVKGSTFFREEADGATVPAGVEVAEVIADTAAAGAGIEVGDLLLSVDGEPLATIEQLVARLRFYRVGDQVAVELERGGERRTITVTLLDRPEGV
ncbi:MAG TPA: trypsin-like peptidase domain-containing protein [Acidimicrobiia bacterium]|nr:trypsin-like peptidase domain-containing protein [Acidimicrobiia bacterium]